MLQNIEKSRHRQLERKAREDRRRALAAQTGSTPVALAAREQEQAEPVETESIEEQPEQPEKKKPAKKAASKKATKKDEESVFDLDEEDDDDLF